MHTKDTPPDPIKDILKQGTDFERKITRDNAIEKLIPPL